MFTIPADHPALPGHFPGQPIVPAVVILDEMSEQLVAFAPGAQISRILSAKFVSPLLPEQPCSVAFVRRDNGQIRFVCSSEGREVASGLLDIDEIAS